MIVIYGAPPAASSRSWARSIAPARRSPWSVSCIELDGEYRWPDELGRNPAVTAGYLQAHGSGLRVLHRLAGGGGLASLAALLAVLVVVAVRRRRVKRELAA